MAAQDRPLELQCPVESIWGCIERTYQAFGLSQSETEWRNHIGASAHLFQATRGCSVFWPCWIRSHWNHSTFRFFLGTRSLLLDCYGLSGQHLYQICAHFLHPCWTGKATVERTNRERYIYISAEAIRSQLIQQPQYLWYCKPLAARPRALEMMQEQGGERKRLPHLCRPNCISPALSPLNYISIPPLWQTSIYHLNVFGSRRQ